MKAILCIQVKFTRKIYEKGKNYKRMILLDILKEYKNGGKTKELDMQSWDTLKL